MKKKAVATVVSAAVRTVGRQRAAKLARFVTNEVRLDQSNVIETNGEALIQRAALTVANPVVLDVGCHFGEWSTSLLAQPGNTPTIHAFEPSRATAAKARRVLGDRAFVHQMALSSTTGETELQIVHEGAGSNSVVPFTQNGRASGSVERIQLTTADRFAIEQGIQDVTLLKIDAEGHDLEVLKGAAGMLDSNQIGLVQFEYNSRWIDSRSFLLDAFELLASFNYQIGKVTSRGVETYTGWHPELESFREGNYLGYLPKWNSTLDTFPWWGPA
jgi:FkbM family methyltransferase